MSKTSTDRPVAIITGGSRGIGFGIAECFAAQGNICVIADVDLFAAQSAAERLIARGGPGSIGVRCDVASRADIDAMVAAVIKACGRIDVLVNNAGICPFVDVMAMSPQTWTKTLDINLTGPFHCTQAVAQQMIEQGGGGRIIFITSLAEEFSGAAQVDYGASKAGLKMAMVGFAAALGKHGITCNAVAPGMILTDMTRHHWEQAGPAEYIKGRVPVGRIGTPTDIGNVCVFLASQAAAYVNGVSIRVDGGYCTTCP